MQGTMLGVPVEGMRILVVDDDVGVLSLLRAQLESQGFTDVVTVGSPVAALKAAAEQRPELVLLDLHMPEMSGFDVIAALAEIFDPPPPVIMLTGDAAPETRYRALSSGARDFLLKPLDALEIRLRVTNLLRSTWLERALAKERDALESRIRDRTFELEQARAEVVERLAIAAEFRDDDTQQHARRIGQMASQIAAAARASARLAREILRAAPLHDVGKIAIPDSVLLKPGPLTPAERSMIEMHCRTGAEILGGSESRLLQMAAQIALTHHERWDGSGYPERLSGDRIPLVGRIVAIADVYDALVHERPYKRAWSREDALDAIRDGAGSAFDPRLVETFLSLDVSVIAQPG